MAMLKVETVAEMLNVSRDVIYRIKDKSDGIKAYRVGRLIRFKSEDVEAYLAQNTVKPPVRQQAFPNMGHFQYTPGMKVV